MRGMVVGLILALLAQWVLADMAYYAWDGQVSTLMGVGAGRLTRVGSVATLNSLGEAEMGPHWSMEFCGVMEVKQAGEYRFTITSDDGGAIYVDDCEVVAVDGIHPSVTRSGSIELAEGRHKVNVLYFNYLLTHTLQGSVRGPDGREVELAAACELGAERLDMAEVQRMAEERSRRVAVRELAGVSTPEALVRSIKYILRQRPREYRVGRELLKQAEGFVGRMDGLVQRFNMGDKGAAAEIEEFDKLKFRALVLENPFIDFDEILAVTGDKIPTRPHWNGTHVMPAKGFNNRIVRLNIKSGVVEEIYAPRDGSFVGEMDLHYDGGKFLFTTTDTNKMYQVMEVGVDGRGLRQVSAMHGDYIDCYGGVYLPDEKIVFSSTATMMGVPCDAGRDTVPNLYIMNPDGSGVRQLTFEQDADWFPTILDDGKIMYLRWEYTDIMHYYSRIMMTMNPDGTNQRAIYGTQSLWPNSMFYARPLPGEPGKYVAVVSGHHGVSCVGKLTLFDTNLGYMHADGAVQHIPGYGKRITHVTVDQLYPKVCPSLLERFPGLQEDVDGLIRKHLTPEVLAGKDYHEINNEFYNRCYPDLRFIYTEMALDLDNLVDDIYPQSLQPYPVSSHYFIVPMRLSEDSRWQLYLVDIFDNLVALPAELTDEQPIVLEPYVVRARKRPPVIPSRVNLESKEATCYVQNVYRGPGLKGVPAGTVKELRVFTYAYAYWKTGDHHHIGVESGWDVKRMLGTVKVEEDGSAMFRIPANTTISLQPLDSEGRAIQLFRSWLVAMPGEELSCIGCHEAPTEPPVATRTIASTKQPQEIKPYRERIEGFAFEVEIQPVLDAYCTRCHDGTNEKLPNFKDRSRPEHKHINDHFSQSYHAFHRYFRRPGPESSGLMLPPYDFHASTSEGVQLLKKGHHGVELDEDSWQRIYTWIDLNVPYHGNWLSVYKPDAGRYAWTQHISAHAAELRDRYAGVADEWEYVPERPYPVKISERQGMSLSPSLSISVANWPFGAEKAAEMQQQAGGGVRRELDLGKGMKIVMVRIPAGEFVMGSDSETSWEQPRQRIRIERPFWMSESEIRNEIYFAFKPDHDAGVFDQQWKDHTRLGYYANYSEQPATRMSWGDARAFCDWVSQQCKVKVDLPTEAQWEWAARAGSDQPFYYGGVEANFGAFANLADRSIRKFAVVGVNPTHFDSLVGNRTLDFIPRIAEVDDGQFLITGTRQYKPNAWGLYDMHGNVAEWTRSDYVRYPYGDVRSNSCDVKLQKVVRGGSFFDRPYRATASYRLGYDSWQGVYNVGFRVVIEE